MMRVPDDELARRFDMPIARLSLPQRLQWVIESRGIETVRDLVQLSPDEVADIRRCGRKTVLTTDRVLHDFLGMSWRDAHTQTRAPVPAVSLDTPLSSAPHMRRLKWLIAARGLKTVRDLVRLTTKDVLATRNCGERTAAEVDAVVRALLGVDWNEARARVDKTTAKPLASHWESALALATAQLEPDASDLVRRRLGIERMAPETIEVVAETLGWSRRRALRVELDALRRVRADLGIIAIGTRLDAVLRGGVVRLMDLGARDACFRVATEQRMTFAAFIDVVLGRARTCRVGDDVVVSTLEASDIVWRLKQLREVGRLPEDVLSRRLGWSRTLTHDLLALLV